MAVFLPALLVQRFSGWFLLFVHRLDSLHSSFKQDLQRLLIQRLDRFGWLYLYAWVLITHVHSFPRPWAEWICFKLDPVHPFDECALSLFFFALSLF